MANQEREPFVLDFPNGQRVEDILKKADQLPTREQIDNDLAAKASNEEVTAARVDADGVTHANLKARCDSDAGKTTQLEEDLKSCARLATGSRPLVHIPTLPTGYMGGGTIQYFPLSESGSFYNVYVNISGSGTIEQGEYILDAQSPIVFGFSAPMPCLINGKAIGSIQLTMNSSDSAPKMVLKIPETISNVASITFNSFVYSRAGFASK